MTVPIEFLVALRPELLDAARRHGDETNRGRHRRRRRRRAWPVLGALVVAAGIAVTAVHPSGGSGEPAASRTPAELVRSIEAGFGRLQIIAVTFGAPPAEYRDQTTGPWMYVQIPSVSGPRSILGSWEANILAAAYAAQAEGAGLTPETGMFRFSTPRCLAELRSNWCDASGGPIVDLDEGATRPVPFDPTSAPRSEVEATIRSGLRAAGLTPTAVTTYVVDHHPAPVVIARTDNPRALFANPPSDASIFGAEPNAFEGVYLEIDDAGGRPLVVQSFASRTAAGVGWIAPQYRTPGPP